MKDYDDIAPLPRVHIVLTNATPDPPEDSLYSNSIDHSQSFEPRRLSQARFAKAPENFFYDNTIAHSEDNLGDSVASGTFGHLVRSVNKETPESDRADQIRKKIRFNLLKIGPKRPSPSEDRCQAWRKFQF